MEDRFSEKPLTPPAPDDLDDVPEDSLSHREKNALRAVRTVVFSLLFFPLLPYAYWMLFRVWRSRGKLSGKPRRQVLLAAAAMLGAPPLLAILVVAALLQPERPQFDLRGYARPAELVGAWTGKELIAKGEVEVVLELRRNGTVRLRESGAVNTDCTGDWGFANHALYLHIKQATRGGETYLKQLIGWQMVRCTDTELFLEDGKTRLQRRP